MLTYLILQLSFVNVLLLAPYYRWGNGGTGSILTYFPKLTWPGCCHAGSEPRQSDVQTLALKDFGTMLTLLPELSVQGTITDKPSALTGTAVQRERQILKPQPHRHLCVESPMINSPRTLCLMDGRILPSIWSTPCRNISMWVFSSPFELLPVRIAPGSVKVLETKDWSSSVLWTTKKIKLQSEVWFIRILLPP